MTGRLILQARMETINQTSFGTQAKLWSAVRYLGVEVDARGEYPSRTDQHEKCRATPGAAQFDAIRGSAFCDEEFVSFWRIADAK
jgi:hypothetical protein